MIVSPMICTFIQYIWVIIHLLHRIVMLNKTLLDETDTHVNITFYLCFFLCVFQRNLTEYYNAVDMNNMMIIFARY